MKTTRVVIVVSNYMKMLRNIVSTMRTYTMVGVRRNKFEHHEGNTSSWYPN